MYLTCVSMIDFFSRCRLKPHQNNSWIYILLWSWLWQYFNYFLTNYLSLDLVISLEEGSFLAAIFLLLLLFLLCTQWLSSSSFLWAGPTAELVQRGYKTLKWSRGFDEIIQSVLYISLFQRIHSKFILENFSLIDIYSTLVSMLCPYFIKTFSKAYSWKYLLWLYLQKG